jgi:hypothetical protein
VHQEVLKRNEKWKDIAMLSALPGLRAIKGIHDEALSEEWKRSPFFPAGAPMAGDLSDFRQRSIDSGHSNHAA